MYSDLLTLGNIELGNGFGINTNILETNIINLSVVITIVIYAVGGALTGLLENRKRLIIESFNKADLEYQNIQDCLTQAQTFYQQAEEKASEIKILLERNLSMLSTIASISPLLGLLGTVVGMIKVFSNIDINGSANTDLLAVGISEALITTAFGLIIAVPAIIFYRYFDQKTLILMSILQSNTSIFLDFLYKK